MKRVVAVLALVGVFGCSAAQKAQDKALAGLKPEDVQTALCAYKAARFYDLSALSTEQAIFLAADLVDCAPGRGDAGAQ